MEEKSKNISMLSTMYASSIHHRKYATSLNGKQISTQYGHIPMQKQTPKWSQSTATWRNSSPRYSFPRDDRFRNVLPYDNDIIQPQIPSTKSPVSCTFGKGQRVPISTIILRNAKQNPSPDRYDLSQVNEGTRNPNKGKSIGEKWNKYQGVRCDHRKDVHSEYFSKNNPPAYYETRQVPGKSKSKFTTYGRLTMYTKYMSDMMSHVPGPHYKINDRHLYGTAGFNSSNFTFDKRLDLSKSANDSPGPSYKHPGFTNKFSNIKRKLGQSDIII